MSALANRRAFGLPADPWADVEIATADAARAAADVRDALAARAMLWIVGPRGSGKTRAVWAALAGLDARVVEPLRLDRERLHLGDVQAAVARDLSDETPRRSGEARSGQTLRLLRGAGRPVAVAVDDAHLLHHRTLKGLRRLRELAGRRTPAAAPCLLLVAQRDAGAELPEVGLRSDALRLGGPTADEAAAALRAAVNRGGRTRFAPEAVAALAASARARNWLDLRRLADDCVAEALARGSRTVDAAVAGAALRPSARPAPARRPARPPSDEAVAAALAARRAA